MITDQDYYYNLREDPNKLYYTSKWQRIYYYSIKAYKASDY